MLESSSFRRGLPLLLLCLLLGSAAAADKREAERAARSAAQPLEKLGFAFRADSWLKELGPEVGKAVRMQLFRGLEYRFVAAVPQNSPAAVSAVVLDFEGKVASQQLGAQGAGRSVTLGIKPKKTGVYVIAVRQEAGSTGSVPCCILTGYK